VYVGGLPSDIRESEIRKEFSRYGKIVETTIKARYAFIVSKLIVKNIINN
jgi:RNA recognition motif-containing protein